MAEAIISFFAPKGGDDYFIYSLDSLLEVVP